MFMRIAATKFTAVIKAFSVFALCMGILVFSKECANGAVDGIKQCLTVLIPSLFPFMCISSFIVKSGLAARIGKPFGKIMRKFFGLSKCFAPVLILSMLGGYPVGAKGIAALYKRREASERECTKAAMFCVCSGPGFLVNYIGVSLYSNKKTGVILLVSQIISVLILGFLNNIFDRERHNYNSVCENKVIGEAIGNSVVEAVADSSKGMLAICSFVVIFSSFAGILNEILTDGIFKNTVLCLCEVCSAVNKMSGSCPIEAIAFATGFGGLSVHFQIFSALGDIKLPKLKFFIIRIIQGVITALLTHTALIIFKDIRPVFSTATVEKAGTYGTTIMPGIALTALIICFLYSIKAFRKN